jgi:hypothetical protein
MLLALVEVLLDHDWSDHELPEMFATRDGGAQIVILGLVNELCLRQVVDAVDKVGNKTLALIDEALEIFSDAPRREICELAVIGDLSGQVRVKELGNLRVVHEDDRVGRV